MKRLATALFGLFVRAPHTAKRASGTGIGLYVARQLVTGMGGDVLYNQCNMYVGGTTAESRANWIAALDRLAALKPKHAVAGHKKEGAPDTPDTIEESKQYLTDFGRLQQSTTSDRELYDEMNKLYPHWSSPQAWLMFGLDLGSLVRQ